MKPLALINPEHVSLTEGETYLLREAARAIVFDIENKIALMNIKNEQYYKLPGGGIEETEDNETALHRECREEIGSEIELVSYIGYIVEYRKMFHLKQISYCYIARVIGEKGESSFTDEELASGSEIVWISYDEALELLADSKTKSIEGRDYIIPRDLTFLKAAKNYFLNAS